MDMDVGHDWTRHRRMQMQERQHVAWKVVKKEQRPTLHSNPPSQPQLKPKRMHLGDRLGLSEALVQRARGTRDHVLQLTLSLCSP